MEQEVDIVTEVDVRKENFTQTPLNFAVGLFREKEATMVPQAHVPEDKSTQTTLNVSMVDPTSPSSSLLHELTPLDQGNADDESGGSGVVRVVRFSSGNPRVETTRGIMRLYRNNSDNPVELPVLHCMEENRSLLLLLSGCLFRKDAIPKILWGYTQRRWADILPPLNLQVRNSAALNVAARSEDLCVLAVPNYMTGADFCQFTGSFIQSIKEMRIVRNDGQIDRYSVLLKFESQNSADEFFQNYNGKPFSSLEVELCHVLFTADVQYTDSGHPGNTPPCGLAELPTCPVCLERFDQQISGILITACNHSFHTSCISKWTDSSCPVCRYCQQHSERSTCSTCGTSENLWLCVICGFVGCGRYDGGHAVEHWKETQHCYSLELETQRVWDYAGDGYVHRLIQSKTDGKLVEVNSPCRGHNEWGSCEGSHIHGIEEVIIQSKMDVITQEYNELLKNQLDSQRQYFEGILIELEQNKEAAISEAVEKAVSLRLQKLNAKLEEAEKKKTFLGQVNESLKLNQESWKKRVKDAEERERMAMKEREERITDLDEQVRDLMVYIEAQKTLAGSASTDIRDGTVFSLSRRPSRSSKSGRKK